MNLLACDSAGRFHVCEDGAACLEKIDKPFTVTAALGDERVGKSTMLTWLSDHSVFPSQSGNMGFTKAVWTALQPSDAGILFLDFEGFAQNAAVNSRLFVLAVLLANVVLHNTHKTIQQDMLGKLQAAGCLAESLVGVSSKPSLLWLLRNYDLDDRENQSDYLRRVLAENGRMGDDLSRLFPERACLAVPEPGRGAIAPGSRKVPEVMQSAVLSIRAELARMSSSKPLMRGPEFVGLLRSVCDAVNHGGEELDLGTVWETKLKAEQRVLKIQRKIEIGQLCRDKLQKKAPASWELAVLTLFSPSDRAEFDDVFDEERERNRKDWAGRLERATAKLQGMLDACPDLQALVGFLSAKYGPAELELVEAAMASLLPALAKKLAAADDFTKARLKEALQACEDASARVAKLDQLVADKTAQFRSAREELQTTLQAQHQGELELKNRELQHEQTRSRSYEAQLKTQTDDLARALAEVFEAKQQHEDTLAESKQLGQALEVERVAHASCKRKLDESEASSEQQVKRLKEEHETQLTMLRATVTELRDQADKLTEQLEQETQDKELAVRHAAELESSRKTLHDEYLRVRGEALRPAVASNNELALKAENESLKAQLARLRDRVLSLR
jgi:hypothetical protein